MQEEKSQFLKEYKQYKENLKFLGGPTEWTEEKVNKLNKIEVFEAIKGFNDLIVFLDSVLYAYEEGAQDWEERCLKAEAKHPAGSNVWVKAELPSKAGDYYCSCMIDGSPKKLIVEFDKNGRWGEAPGYDYYESFEIIEWLNESDEQPVEQKLPNDVVEKLLKVRDYIAIGEYDEAYHHLYGIANPGYDSYFPWKELELQVEYVKLNEIQLKEKKQSGEQKENDAAPLTQEEEDFLRDCNFYPHVKGAAKILTENDEGAYMDNDDLIKLSDIIYRYAKGYQKQNKR